MKFRLTILASLLTVFAVEPCLYARLGETEGEVDQRYGQSYEYPANNTRELEVLGLVVKAVDPEEKDDPQFPRVTGFPGVKVKTYNFHGFLIEVAFINGKSEAESYIRKDKSGLEDADIEALLAANSLGSKWQPGSKTFVYSNWNLASAAAIARYQDSHGLVVLTKKMSDYVLQLKKASLDKTAQEKANQRQGF